MPGSILDTGDAERNKAGGIPALTELLLSLWGEEMGKGSRLLNKQMKKCLSVSWWSTIRRKIKQDRLGNST